jgi:hypothetical protein
MGMLILAITKSFLIGKNVEKIKKLQNKIIWFFYDLKAPLASVAAGIMYSSLFTIPFILVASYHSSENVINYS